MSEKLSIFHTNLKLDKFVLFRNRKITKLTSKQNQIYLDLNSSYQLLKFINKMTTMNSPFQVQQLQQRNMVIDYTIQQDLQNVLSIAAEYCAVLEVFQNQPDHPIVQIQRNRLNAILNMSHTIHFDLGFNSQRDYQTLTAAKQEAKRQCRMIIQLQKFQEVKELVEKEYIQKNLISDVRGLQLIEVTQSPLQQFDSKLVEKIVNSIQQTDQMYANLQNGQSFYKQNDQELWIYLNDRYEQAKQKLSHNFGCSGQQMLSTNQEPATNIAQKKYDNRIKSDLYTKNYAENVFQRRLRMIFLLIDSQLSINLCQDQYESLDQNFENKLYVSMQQQIKCHSLKSYLTKGSEIHLQTYKNTLVEEIQKLKEMYQKIYNDYPLDLSCKLREILNYQTNIQNINFNQHDILTKIDQFLQYYRVWFSNSQLELLKNDLIGLVQRK